MTSMGISTLPESALIHAPTRAAMAGIRIGTCGGNLKPASPKHLGAVRNVRFRLSGDG
jgi:hypothetical protein